MRHEPRQIFFMILVQHKATISVEGKQSLKKTYYLKTCYLKKNTGLFYFFDETFKFSTARFFDTHGSIQIRF